MSLGALRLTKQCFRVSLSQILLILKVQCLSPKSKLDDLLPILFFKSYNFSQTHGVAY